MSTAVDTRLDELATKRDMTELKTYIIKWVAGMLAARAAVIAAPDKAGLEMTGVPDILL